MNGEGDISSSLSITTLCPLKCKKCGSGHVGKKARIVFFPAATTAFLVSFFCCFNCLFFMTLIDNNKNRKFSITFAVKYYVKDFRIKTFNEQRDKKDGQEELK